MQSSSPFISVIITAYNDEVYAARAIESVLQQTFTDYEILLIDNNSTDGTLTVFHTYQQKHPDVVRIFQEKKQGCPSARNRGLLESRGEWIQILDSDDEIMPMKFENQLPLTKNKDVELIVGGRWKYKMTNNGLQTKKKLPESSDMWKALLLFRFGSTNSCLWKRKTLMDLNGWNESWTSVEDYEMYFRALKYGVIPVFDLHADAIVHMRVESMSRSSDQKKTIEHINNALNLRFLIKDHLIITGYYSRELQQEFETDLYFKLLRWKPKAPEFMERKIKELELFIPLKEIIKHKLQVIKSNLKKIKINIHKNQLRN